MKELHKIWQKHWREILGEPTDAMPEDLDADYALQFDVWDLDKAKLAECFSIFPNGQKMLNRVLRAFAEPRQNKKVSDDVLLDLLEQMNTRTERVIQSFGDKTAIALNDEKKQCTARNLYRGNEELRRKVFQKADTPTIHMDDDLFDMIKQKRGDEAYAACFFLKEPLYIFGGNYYDIVHWVLWAMVEDDYPVDPYQPGYDLLQTYAQAGWGKEEMFVFIEEAHG